MQRELLEKDAILLQQDAASWEDAIKKAGQLLIDTGKIQESYIEATIRNIHELGPYILIAPNVALPHSRPEDGVLEQGISVLTLRKSVEFDSEKPFKLVICLAAVDENLHIEMLQKIAEVIADEALVNKLLSSTSVDEVYKMFNGEVS
ncbi:PTS sugar transporter subunit IIA [Solibacillus sp. MA9]|uniref:Ascorbate-specific PTS system EIIA component n=1 Tax=Solibacillus palustris TaxID=2908203 RepID=A0ABS9UAM6_9BACL|nr:PTS sugar transporter subunit IIA [Solibacillus sp. MA9]MCH7321392.1 PTS sugar transporter subunit IIA [Solibacillus sp. MA9]